MGFEYTLETYDPQRVGLESFLMGLPEFLNEDEGRINLTANGTEVAITVSINESRVHVAQHVSCRKADEILGLLIRKILTLNDHVVVSEQRSGSGP